MTTEIVSGITKLTGIAPQFLVDDLDGAIAYYANGLGLANMGSSAHVGMHWCAWTA